MTSLYAFALRHPRWTILLATVLTTAAGTGLGKLELRVDGNALVPHDAPEVLYDRRVRETFDVEDQIAVVVRTDDPAGIFNLRTLRLVDVLTGVLRDVDGVDPAEVTSLATEHSRWSGRRNALDFDTFLDPFPQDEDDLARLRDDVRGMEIYTGTLVSKDGGMGAGPWSPSATAILVGVEEDADRQTLYQRIQEAVHAATGESGEDTVHVVGAPVAESLLGTYLLEDLSRLVPATVLLMCLIFYGRYRSLLAVALPMTEVGAALVFTFGVMGHSGVPVSLPTTVMPVILTALGIADEIHVFDRYARLRARTEEGGGVLRRTMDEMWRPVVKTSVTTAIAFLSFVLSPIAPVRHFGTFTALGTLFCMVWSLTVIPAGLKLGRQHGFTALADDGGSERCARLAGGVRRRRAAVLVLTLAAVLLVPLGVRRLVVQDSWIDGFAPSSPFRRATEEVNRLFHGTHLLYVHLDARPGTVAGEVTAFPPGVTVPERFVAEIPAGDMDPEALVGERLLLAATPVGVGQRQPLRKRRADLLAEIRSARRGGDTIYVDVIPEMTENSRYYLASVKRAWTFTASGERLLDPRLLERLHETGTFIKEDLSAVGGGVLDPHDQISVVRYIMYGGRDAERRIGTTPLRNRHLLAVFAKVRGAERVEEVVDASFQQALITVFLKNANFVDVGRLMDAVRADVRERLEPLGFHVGFAGDVAVSQAMIGAVVDTQTRSLLLSLAGIFLVAALLARSLWVGLLCLLPPALAVAFSFAFMGFFGVPLGVATSMFSAMTIGIGIDFAIHLTERYRQTSVLSDAGERLREAMAVTGPAIAVNTLVVALGFGVLAFSNVPANGRLGLLVLVSVLTCFVTTLVLLPGLLAWRPSR